MDSGDADELDYEEDESAVDSVKTGPRNENLSESEDQYLQLDCPEEIESLFSFKEPVEDVSTKTQNVEEAVSEKEERKNLSPKNPSPRVEQPTEANTANSEDNNSIVKNGTTYKIPRIHNNYRKSSNFFRRRPEINENVLNYSYMSPMLPEANFGVPGSLTNGFPVCAQNRNFHPNESLFSTPKKNFQPLMSVKTSVPFSKLRTFSPNGGPRKSNFAWRRNRITRRHCIQNVRKRKNQYVCNNNIQTVENQRNFTHRTFHDPGVKINECGFGKKNNSSILDLQYTSMKPDEKELVSLKKEARLKRFSNDEMVRKEKVPNDSGVDEKHKWNLENLEQEYFQKMEEQKLTRERLFSLKEMKKNCYSDQTFSDFHKEKPSINKESLLEKRNPFDFFARFKNFTNFQIEKPNINKETLLRKRNPFDESSKTPKVSFGTEIKKESCACKIKEEHVGDESIASFKIDLQPTKNIGNITTGLGAFGQSFCDVKNETNSTVKFVRTVSKCFDDLSFKKPKTEMVFNNNTDVPQFFNQVKTSPSLEEKKINIPIQNFPTQLESQLTGCIVKVLNIPPTTTTNDILALCCPIGMVREVKLNFPKENSVVIRFVEPSCADKFFSLYHGQKMNNYFLNVIIV